MTNEQVKCPACGEGMEHATFVNDEEFFQCLTTSCLDGIYSKDDLSFIQSRISKAVQVAVQQERENRRKISNNEMLLLKGLISALHALGDGVCISQDVPVSFKEDIWATIEEVELIYDKIIQEPQNDN